MKKALSLILALLMVFGSIVVVNAESKTPDTGYCAVGVVDTATSRAAILTGDGTIKTVYYFGTAPVAGELYTYSQRTENVYSFTNVSYFNSKAYGAWGFATNTEYKYMNDGYYIPYYVDSATTVFARYSDTEWRVFKGTDIIKSNVYPVMGYISLRDENGIKKVNTLLIGNYTGGSMIPADQGSTVPFDTAGTGWTSGDKTITMENIVSVPAYNFCAVGIVDSTLSKAAIVLADGTTKTVFYSGTVPEIGEIYSYQDLGDNTYSFTKTGFTPGTTKAAASFGVRTFADSQQIYSGLNMYFDENTVIFARYSDTEWRVFHGFGSIKGSDWPCYMYYSSMANTYDSTPIVTAGLIGSFNTQNNTIVPADTASTKLFDPQGVGFTTGNISVTMEDIGQQAEKGYCAVGEVDTATKRASILKTDGSIKTVFYVGNAPETGTIYTYTEVSENNYSFEKLGFLNSTSGSAWGFAVNPSGSYMNDSTYVPYHVDDYTVVFARYSNTEWRVFSGPNVMKNAGYPAMGYISLRNESNVYKVNLLMLGDLNTVSGEIIPTDANSTRYFDSTGQGFSNGDKTVTFDNSEREIGDLDNDGLLSPLDLIKYQNVLLGREHFTNAQLLAADINADEANNILDLLELKELVLGSVGLPNALYAPAIFKGIYTSEDIIVAEINAVRLGADPTGLKDSTKAIKSAIDLCAANGGGTVWLPAGRYLVTDSFSIPSFVTLRGDYQDPDTGNNYGTVIFAKVKNSNQQGAQPLFTIGGSAGVYGLTVYYPDQSLNNVVPYPYTFYVSGLGDSYMQQSVINCTVINGYNGIGASVYYATPHESLTVENFKGTFLHTGAEAYNQADVGTWKNVILSNKYWANANTALNMTAPSRASIDANTRINVTGMILGDLEWTEFYNLQISDCKTGINIVKGQRIEFAGSLYLVKIENCDTGIKIDSIDTRWGMVLANSNIFGSVNSIVNSTNGTVKLAGVVLNGAVSGSVVTDNTNLSVYTIPNASVSKPVSKLYCFNADTSGATDVSAKLQALLNQAGQTGGIVYLPAGKYKLSNPVSVPAGVELRGTSSVATRDQNGNSNGTLILAYYGKNSSSAETATALVTLGENAGVRGMRFIYPENNASVATNIYPYTIRGTGSGVYVTNCCIAAASYGVDFRGCDNHVIKRLIACCYVNTMAVGGANGIVEGCLQNATVVVRNGLNLPNWTLETDVFDDIFNPITRVNTTYILIENAQNQKVLNTFAYGVKTFAKAVNSSDSLLINIGADNLGTGSPMLNTSVGSLTAINMMRWNGSSYSNVSTQLKLYNRLTINVSGENTVA